MTTIGIENPFCVEETLTALRSAQASGKEHAKAVPASNSQVALVEHPRHR